jgi:hypothetical protein
MAGPVINNGLSHTAPLASTVCFHCLLPRLTLCVCGTQLGAHHQALQKLVDVLPEVRHKVRIVKPAQLGTPVARATTHSGKFKEFGRGCGVLVLGREGKGQ